MRWVDGQMLCDAARRGNIEVMRILFRVRYSPDPAILPFIPACINYGQFNLAGERLTPLAEAARNGHAAIVDELLAAGARVDLEHNLLSRSPILKAAAMGILRLPIGFDKE